MESFSGLAFSLVVLLCLLMTAHVSAIMSCTKKTLCSCESENGIIDLSSLSTNPPRKIPDPTSSQTFLWNPCDNFDYQSLNGVGAVQEQSASYIYELGTNRDDLVNVKVATGHAVFVMTATDGQRQAEVTCICGSGSAVSMVFTQEIPGYPSIYQFTLTAPQCCPGYSPSSASGGLSVGSVMTIM
ncbi:uncharacterized protein LOC101853744 isoform X2 [Aplysia californica]|uniref:Uncharacterized protein LOC101853744 isoform X2 n=1 Tax=Aplysia californica TaxID=6500 RepID=A0ABM0K8E1_APLCA|nr:uncharacterized protein LOC101853744 isoform X2 [Aplysia californica]